MARLHFVKKARKPIPSAGVKVGDSYYWWKFMQGGRGGPKRVSKTRPRRSQLTQSEFLGSMYDAEDAIADAGNAFDKDGDFEDLASQCESVASDVRDAGEGCRERYQNMPEGLQQGDSGQLLETRADECDTLADELERAAGEIRSHAENENKEDGKDAARGELENISWSYS